MQSANRMAFKEWGVVCAALGEGRQSLIFRKGGIHEGRDGFRVAHSEFWLFPTQFHEGAEALIDDAQPLLEQVRQEWPAAGQIRLQEYARVTDVLELRQERTLSQAAGRHIWSPRTLANRYHYRQPGLFALIVRMYRRPAPLLLPDSPHFGGCRSWLDLPAEISTEGLVAVLDDAAFEAERARLRACLAEVATV